MGRLPRTQRRELCNSTIERLALPPNATSSDACYRVGALMGELLGADLELRFIRVRDNNFSGITARRADGTYIVYCARSRSWYHRLGILLHELAHVLLGHKPVSLGSDSGIRRFLPNLPDKMIQIIANRTELADAEEQDAEALADDILSRLDDITRAESHRSSARSDAVKRIAEAFDDHPRQDI